MIALKVTFRSESVTSYLNKLKNSLGGMSAESHLWEKIWKGEEKKRENARQKGRKEKEMEKGERKRGNKK
jgi:hypothetical protein